MTTRLGEIRILYMRELRSAMRERNIVINSLILPLVLYPVILWLVAAGVTFVIGQSEAAASRVMLRNVPGQHAALPDFLSGEEGIELGVVASPEAALREGTLDLLVDFVGSSSAVPGAVELAYDGSRDRSSTARSRVEDSLERYRRRYLIGLVEARQIPYRDVQQIWIERQNMATGQDMGRFILGLMVPVFMIVMLSVGGMYPAIDSTAGEREHGTWETLMTVAASRGSILVSKYLYVTTMSFAAGMLNLVGMSLSLGTILRPLLGSAVEEGSLEFPLDAVPVIAVGAALLALFIAAGMMILASFARTFKEGQSLVGPFYIAVFLPVMFLQAPDLEFSATFALIPVVNVMMMFREAFAGVYQWPMIGLTAGVELATVALMLLVANKILQYEDFVIGGYFGNLGRFIRRRMFPGRAA